MSTSPCCSASTASRGPATSGQLGSYGATDATEAIFLILVLLFGTA